MKFTILVAPSLVIITTYFVCLINAWEERRRLLKKYSNFTLFTIKLPPLWVGVMKFTISCLLTLQMLHTKFGLDSPSSSWEEDVNTWQTTDDDGRQPIAIGHLSYSGYSGDLKMCCRKGLKINVNMYKQWIVLFQKM